MLGLLLPRQATKLIPCASSAVISGGLDLSPMNDSDPHNNSALYFNPPSTATDDANETSTSPHAGQPPRPPPLPSFGPAAHRPPLASQPPSTTLSPTSFFKTPAYFWNQAVPSAIWAGLGTSMGAIDPTVAEQPPAAGSGFGQQLEMDDGAQCGNPGNFLQGNALQEVLGGAGAVGETGGLDTGIGSTGGGGSAGQDGQVVCLPISCFEFHYAARPVHLTDTIFLPSEQLGLRSPNVLHARIFGQAILRSDVLFRAGFRSTPLSSGPRLVNPQLPSTSHDLRPNWHPHACGGTNERIRIRG